MASKITMNTLKQEVKNNFTNEEVIVKSRFNREYKFILNKNVKILDIDYALEKLGEIIKYCNENKIEINMIAYSIILLFKVYTNLPFMRDDESNIRIGVKNDIDLLEHIVELGLDKAIVDTIGKDKQDELNEMIYKKTYGYKAIGDMQVSNMIATDKIKVGEVDE